MFELVGLCWWALLHAAVPPACVSSQHMPARLCADIAAAEECFSQIHLVLEPPLRMVGRPYVCWFKAAWSLPACLSNAVHDDCGCSSVWPSCFSRMASQPAVPCWLGRSRTAPLHLAWAVQSRAGGWLGFVGVQLHVWQVATCWCDCQLQESIDTAGDCAGSGALLCRRSAWQGEARAADEQQSTCCAAPPLLLVS